MTDQRTPEEVAWDVEGRLNFPLGSDVHSVLRELVEELDGRYDQ